MKDVRLLPLLMIAAGALLSLKVLTLALGRPPELGVTPAHAQTAEAQDAASADAGAPADMAAATPEPSAETGVEGLDQMPDAKNSAPAIAESLAERRETLEERARDLDLREKLLAATQQRVEERIAELEAIEQRIDQMLNKRKEQEEARFTGLVEMYAKMKPKDAATILNGLEMPVLQRVATAIAPRQMSEIMAEMDPKVAQKLTMELSAEPEDLAIEAAGPGELPKIVGTRKPN